MIGIIGVGHLAEYLLRGMIRAGWRGDEIILSPRGQFARLSVDLGCRVAPSNEGLVAQADLVLLMVRPAQAEEAVRGLGWREGQVLVSCCAGVPIALLADAASPARVVRTMPISAVAIGASPTTMYPDEARVRTLFEGLGEVLPLASEDQFDVAAVSAAVYGWVHDLIGQSADWAQGRGLDEALARRLSARTFAAAASMVLEDESKPISALVRTLATPGGITERGLEELHREGGDRAWRQACSAAFEKLTAARRNA